MEMREILNLFESAGQHSEVKAIAGVIAEEDGKKQSKNNFHMFMNMNPLNWEVIEEYTPFNMKGVIYLKQKNNKPPITQLGSSKIFNYAITTDKGIGIPAIFAGTLKLKDLESDSEYLIYVFDKDANENKVWFEMAKINPANFKGLAAYTVL